MTSAVWKQIRSTGVAGIAMQPLSSLVVVCILFFFFIDVGLLWALKTPKHADHVSSNKLYDPTISPVILIFARERTSHLRRLLHSISSATPDELREGLSVIVSVDGNRRAQQYGLINLPC